MLKPSVLKARLVNRISRLENDLAVAGKGTKKARIEKALAFTKRELEKLDKYMKEIRDMPKPK